MRPPIERIRLLAARIAVLALAVTALVLLMRSDALHEALVALFATARDIIAAHPVAGLLVFVGLGALSAMMGFFSSAVLIPAAVLAWGMLPTMALLWVGWTIGGAIAHSLAYYFGRPLLRWLVPPAKLARYERMMERRPRFSTVVLMQFAIPSEILGYLLGLARYPLLRYLAALSIAEIPYVVGTVLLGVSFMERNATTMILVSVGGIAMLLVVANALRKRRPPTSQA